MKNQCRYCDDEQVVEMDNNGPIVSCPVCQPGESVTLTVEG